MRHHAIKIIEKNRNLIRNILDQDLSWADNENCWFLLPEDGSKSFVMNDYGFFSRFPNASRNITIQVVK